MRPMSRRSRVHFTLAAGGLLFPLCLVAGPAVGAPARPHIVNLPNGSQHTEPSLAIDRDGRIYVSAILGFPGDVSAPGTPVWRSVDGGRTFTQHSTASVGPAATVLGGGDSALAVDKRGTVYASDLWLGDDSIAISTDHANSWLGSPVSHRVVSDRNWLAYSPKDDALYQVWDGVDAVYVARADLGGPLGEKEALSFPFTSRVVSQIVPLPGEPYRSQFAWPGGIAVSATTGYVYVTWSDTNGVAVAESRDKGTTWTTTHVPGTRLAGSFNDTAWNYVPVGVDSAGNVFVAWAEATGSPTPARIQVNVATARAGLASWRQQGVSTETTAVMPTLAVDDSDSVGLAFIEANAAGNPNDRAFSGVTWRLQYAHLHGLAQGRPRLRAETVEADVHDGTVFVGPQGGDRGMGDFFTLGFLPNRTPVIAYTRGQIGHNISRVATLPIIR